MLPTTKLMNTLLPLAAVLVLASPLAAQEEFREFIDVANRMGGPVVEKETDHFKISATSGAAALLGAHGENLWTFLNETLGVAPSEKIHLTFFLTGRGAEQLGVGNFESYDAEADVLY